jgi:DMSO/TMAO reductase YedYZ heme-binding membrane subunit
MLMHASLSWLAVGFGLVHGLLLMRDDYFTYRLTDVLIPFTGPYRPLAVGLGILSFWIAFVVTISFSMRKQLGNRVWKTLHLSSYLMFGMVTIHGLLAGSDGGRLGFRMMLGLSMLSVISLLIYRTMKKSSKAEPRRRAAAVTAQAE